MNMLKLAAVTMGAVVVSTSLALAGNGGIQINQPGNIDINKGGILQLAKVATCDVAGSPSEFPNDIWVTNKGAGKLDAGTKVQWSIPGYGNTYKGTYTLVAALNPGQGVHLLNILPNGVEAGHDCKAKAL
jgi:hypothetical protein